jgi:predicted ATP-grasp superfamily ATP-dependent carboligase
VRIYRNVKFENEPIMLASWPGMGNVGIISTDYLRSKMNAEVLAEIDMSPYFVPESIVVEDGLAELPELPRSVIYYTHNPDMLIFESNAQIAGKEGISIIKKLVQFAEMYKVKRIFTAAAFAQDVSHSSTPQILGAFNRQDMIDEFKAVGVKPMETGYIAGLNGLMLGVAANYDIEAGCFLGTIPTFAANLAYPKASLEIIKLMENVFDINVDTSDLEKSIELVTTQFTEIEEKIRELYPDAMEDEEDDDEDEPWRLEISEEELGEDEVPRYIMDKIERLFEEVKRDRSKAPILKKELDRWKLYELYEHRFLNIFK